MSKRILTGRNSQNGMGRGFFLDGVGEGLKTRSVSTSTLNMKESANIKRNLQHLEKLLIGIVWNLGKIKNPKSQRFEITEV